MSCGVTVSCTATVSYSATVSCGVTCPERNRVLQRNRGRHHRPRAVRLGSRSRPRVPAGPWPPSNRLLLVLADRVHSGDVFQDRVGSSEAKGHVDQDFGGRRVLRPPTILAHENPHLLVAGPSKPEALRGRAGDSRDLGRAQLLRGEPLDLGAETERDAWSKVADASSLPDSPEKLCAETVPLPCPSNSLLQGGPAPRLAAGSQGEALGDVVARAVGACR